MGRPVPRSVPTRLVPVPDAPALLLEPDRRDAPRTLVIADVHLGLGGTLERPGGPPEGSADRLADQLIALVKSTGTEEVLIAGDAKHPIVGTPPTLRPVVFGFFARILSDDVRVGLVLGNHDVGIVPHLPREVDVFPVGGTVRDGVGIFHGHAWPSNSVLRASRLVAGHLHPGFRLAPTAADPDGKRRCWVRVEREPEPARPVRRRRHADVSAREIVVVPAFNPVAGTESLNRDRPARGRSFLYGRFLSRGVARAYLLDGTDLGPLPIPKTSASAPPGATRAHRGR